MNDRMSILLISKEAFNKADGLMTHLIHKELLKFGRLPKDYQIENIKIHEGGLDVLIQSEEFKPVPLG